MHTLHKCVCPDHIHHSGASSKRTTRPNNNKNDPVPYIPVPELFVIRARHFACDHSACWWYTQHNYTHYQSQSRSLVGPLMEMEFRMFIIVQVDEIYENVEFIAPNNRNTKMHECVRKPTAQEHIRTKIHEPRACGS